MDHFPAGTPSDVLYIFSKDLNYKKFSGDFLGGNGKNDSLAIKLNFGSNSLFITCLFSFFTERANIPKSWDVFGTKSLDVVGTIKRRHPNKLLKINSQNTFTC